MRFRTWAPLPLFGWPQVALIPLVNVVILLLGFLTLQSSLFVPAGLSLQLPKAVTAEAVGGAGVVITVTDQRLIYVNGQLTSSEELAAILQPALRHTPTVLIKADAQTPIGDMARIWDLCRQLGASRIAMATTKPSS